MTRILLLLLLSVPMWALSQASQRFAKLHIREGEGVSIGNATGGLEEVTIDTLRMERNSTLNLGKGETRIRVVIGYAVVDSGAVLTAPTGARGSDGTEPGASGQSGAAGCELDISLGIGQLANLTVESVGGDGGNGVAGARGRSGLKAQCPHEKGRNGGRGQAGGAGGSGGPGGKVTVRYRYVGSTQTTPPALIWRNVGGSGGAGGRGGDGGKGGKGRKCGFYRLGGGSTGSRGANGPHGNPGSSGAQDVFYAG